MIDKENLAFIKKHIGMFFIDENSQVEITNFFYGYLYAYSRCLADSEQSRKNYNDELSEFLKMKYQYQSARHWTALIDTLYEQHKQSDEKFYQFLIDNLIDFQTLKQFG
ncbi:hypothetical protein [Bartonella sp. HY761]|uniref:hypothetical protein n=1 Tax=Bartonella sp. HY761 TaxID=2979330 RepID=UPI0021E2FE76|nr:hypothetical protein [Bartonella sp. HY761]UXN08076.1 hypothetical protein N6A79_14980 [Bartonella sp. HY761]